MSSNDPLAQLLGSILGGAAQQPARTSRGGAAQQPARTSRGGAPQGDALGGLLGAILGGAAQPGGMSGGTQSGDEFGDLLGSILGGGAPQGGMSGGMQPSGGLGDLLGSILGGAAQPSGRSQPTGDVLGRLGDSATRDGLNVGGTRKRTQAPAPASTGVPDLLGALLGGGSGAGSIASSPVLAPISDAVAKKLGIAPELAQVVVGFAVNALMSSLISNTAQRRGLIAQTEEQPFDLDDLVQRMRTGKRLDKRYLKSTGLVDQLAEQAGMDKDTATKSLQQTFKLLGAQMPSG